MYYGVFHFVQHTAALLETPRVSAPPDCAWFDVKSPQLRRGGDPGALFFPDVLRLFCKGIARVLTQPGHAAGHPNGDNFAAHRGDTCRGDRNGDDCLAITPFFDPATNLQFHSKRRRLQVVDMKGSSDIARRGCFPDASSRC